MDEFCTSRTLLMELKEGGSEEAWERFCASYRPFIYSLVSKCGVPHEDCRELVQDVLVKVWKALGDFLYVKERCRFRTWLGTVARNTALNFMNSKASRQSRQHAPDNLISHFGTSPEIDEIAEREWQIFVTRKAWDQIQPLSTAFCMTTQGSNHSW